MATCSMCKLEKSTEDFHASRNSKTGIQSRCKQCVRETDAARPPRKTTEARRDRYYRDTYGMSLEDVKAMLAAQGGVCAICSALPDVTGAGNGLALGLVVDHCHATGKVRGLLCNTCNRTLGLLNDNIDTLVSATSYLMAHEDVLAGAGGYHG